MPKIPLFFLGLLALCSHHVLAVTVYGQQGMTIPSGLASTDSSAATATAAALDWLSDLEAYNTVTLTAPTLPTPVPSAFGITVQNSGASVSGMSVQQKGDFFGFSIEMSVVQQVSECLPVSCILHWISRWLCAPRPVGKNSYA